MTEILKISFGSTNKSSAILVATPNTIIARSALISSPLNLLAANTPNCAPITEAIIRKNAKNTSYILVRVTFHRIVWNSRNAISKLERLEDPKLYQDFFTRLSKSVFLEANSI